MRVLVVLILFCCWQRAAAQKESYNWCFGLGAGLNFSTDPPTPFQSSINSSEASASISDSAGNLLFYTDGITAFNRNHDTLMNGTYLSAEQQQGGYPNTCSQGALILPMPYNSNLYYIIGHSDSATITTPFNPPFTDIVYYSVVDMRLDNGLGGVLPNQKKILLSGNRFVERMVAFRMADGKNWGIFMHGLTDTFYLFILDSTGINLASKQKIGTDFSIGFPLLTAGQMALSKDASKLCIYTKNSLATIDVFDLNRCTGELTNHRNFAFSTALRVSYYGCSFSPDGKLIYVAETCFACAGVRTGAIFQLDIDSGIIRYIGTNNLGHPTQLQTGPDGKIYASIVPNESQMSYPYVATITFPNLLGNSCNFQVQGVYLGGRMGSSGLPNMPNYGLGKLEAKAAFGDSISILNPVEVTFQDSSTGQISSWFWSFGDGLTSNARNPTHSYAAPGTYAVRLIVYNCVGADTVIKNIVVGTTSTQPIDNEAITIKPNPTTGLLVIEVGAAAENPVEAVILSLFGQELLKTKLTGNRQTVDLSSLPDGVYLLQINSNQRVIKTQKIMISR